MSIDDLFGWRFIFDDELILGRGYFIFIMERLESERFRFEEDSAEQIE